jgi:hypothetical protein
VEIEGMDAFFCLKYRTGVADPLLQVVAEPGLKVTCESEIRGLEEVSGWGSGFDPYVNRGSPGCALALSNVAMAAQHAQMAVIVKLQLNAGLCRCEVLLLADLFICLPWVFRWFRSSFYRCLERIELFVFSLRIPTLNTT